MHARDRVTSFAILLSLSVALALTLGSTPSLASAATRADTISRFDLPAEALDKALRDFAVQANCNISYEPSLVSGLRAPAIKGDYTPSDALSLLLKGTRLRAVNINEDTIQVLERSASTSKDSPAAINHDAPATIHVASASPDTPTAPPSPPTDSTNANSASPNTTDTGEKGLQEIVVTGTNIRGVENKTVPLLTFDREAIERSGYATIEDFIDSLPQNVKSGTNSADGILAAGQGFTNVENSTAANLRGLGSSSTLTLLNGHRLAASSYGSGVDLSMIPLSAVERIEVLTDGSSAIYGADAVGGVINIILRNDFNGAETSARFDTLSRGGGEQKQIGQSLGRTWGQDNWSEGGALAVLQFQDSNAIHSPQRAFTTSLPMPTDIYPSAKRYSSVFSAHQGLPASLEMFGDALLARDDSFRAFTTGGAFSQIQRLASKTDNTSANAGLRWQPFGDWHLEGSVLFSQVYTQIKAEITPSSFGYINGAPYLRNVFTTKEADVKLDGTLWASGGASVKAAAGASYRREAFSSLIEFIPLDRAVDRDVHAVFAELYAPLITAVNALPFVRKLELSAAVRKDNYSDFGAKTNPRFGLFWAPWGPIALRASFSTSFRAPNPNEIVSNLAATNLFVENDYPLPNNSGASEIFYGNQTLGPETSRNLTAGLDFLPPTLPGTRVSLNYYRIVYSNRLINSPDAADVFTNPSVYGSLVRQFASDAAAAAFVASLELPQTLIDYTTGGTGLANVRYGFPYGEINAARVKTEGLDLGAHSLLSLSGTDNLTADFNATFIKDLATSFCNTCTSTDLVNTYGQPLKLRLRAATGWSNGIWSTNAAVNFSNAYTDTNLLPFGHIASYTTVDFNASWHIPASPGTTVGLNITNLGNVDPPHTAPAFNKVVYDPTNADARGRSLSLQVRQQW